MNSEHKKTEIKNRNTHISKILALVLSTSVFLSSGLIHSYAVEENSENNLTENTQITENNIIESTVTEKTSTTELETVENTSELTNIENQNANNSSPIIAIIPMDEEGIKISNTGQNDPQILVVREDKSVSLEQPSENLKYVPKTAQVDGYVNQVKPELEALNYEDLYDILNVRERFLDREAIKRRLRAELSREPSDEEVNAAVRKFYLDKLDMRDSFNKVKDELDTILKGLFERSENIDVNTIIQNKKQILLGLAFLERQYKFEFKGIKAKDLILYHPEVFGTTTSPIDRIIQIGRMSYLDAQLQFNERTYNNKIAGITNQNTLLDFITHTRSIFDPNNTDAQWFKQQSKAYIVETQSPHGSSLLFEKMKKDTRLRSHLIPLLTLTEDGIYVISTTSTVNYGLSDTYLADRSPAQISAFKEKLNKTANEQQAFLDFWFRISQTKEKLLEGPDIVVIDTMQKYGPPNASARDLWSPQTGPNTASGVKEFMAHFPGFYRDYIFIDGEANQQARLINLFLAKSLTDRGQSTYTHEVTHILDKLVWFDGFGRRDGQGAEVYARGLFEIDNNTPGVSNYPPMFNLNLTFELDNNRVQNTSPTRFMQESDLKEYMQGVMDVLYTLDYAEAKASLEKPVSDKKILFNKVELTPDTARQNQVKDTFSNINDETAAKLNTINDLVDNAITSGRLEFKGNQTTGTAQPNGYHIVPLFEPIYAGVQNNNGSAGDITFRRYSYELLGEYGYKQGMMPYLSNKYANDQEVLNAVLDPKYSGNLAEFKKDMFKRRIDKLSQLKPTSVYNTYEELQALMNQAVQADLDRMKLNIANGQPPTTGVKAVRDLKTRIFQSYLNSTNDFRESIYKSETGTVSETEDVEIPVVVNNVEDSSQWADYENTVEGTAGLKRITRTWNTENGQKVGEPTVSETVVRQMVPTVVTRGTKPVNGEIVTTRDEIIPVTETIIDDPSMFVGQTRREEGSDGMKRVTTTQPTVKGVPNGNPTVREEIITAMVPTKVYRGTKPVAGTVSETEDVEIPVVVNNVEDSSQWADYENTVEGTAGLKRITRTWNTENGQKVGEPTVSETVVRQMVPTVVTRGTKPVNGETVTTEEVDIPITETIVLDPQKWEDESATVVGTIGRKRITTIQPTVKGVPTGQPTVLEGIIVQMVPTVVTRGTKPVNGEIVTTRDEVIPVTETIIDDPSMFVGQTRREEGSDGMKRVTTIQPTVKGVPSGQPVVNEVVTKQMVPTKVFKGTKAIPGTVTETEEVEIPVTETIIDDPSLLVGTSRTVQGTVGLKRITRTWNTENGQKVGDPIVSETVITEMIPTKIYKGTKPSDTEKVVEKVGYPAYIELPIYKLPAIPENNDKPRVEKAEKAEKVEKTLSNTGINTNQILTLLSLSLLLGLFFTRIRKTNK